MDDRTIKETLEKQLQLLSERSSDSLCEAMELVSLSEAMVSISRFLIDPSTSHSHASHDNLS